MTQIPAAVEPYVSRETHQALSLYVALIEKWNPKINLVARSQLGELWQRHIWDSAQIWPLVCGTTHHVDMGSGGGLPGLVLAIIARSQTPDARFSMIESDIRKSVFLRTVARELGLNVGVHDKRYQFVPPAAADTVSARALAPLTDLLGAADRHLKPEGSAVFPKGARWAEEIDAARVNWTFDVEAIPSITEPQAALLKIKEISRV